MENVPESFLEAKVSIATVVSKAKSSPMVVDKVRQQSDKRAENLKSEKLSQTSRIYLPHRH